VEPTVTPARPQPLDRPPEPGDAQLLDRFVRVREEAAFAALLQRHAGMVLRVCRRVLHDAHDAEDAFQATFLLLARKAGSIRKRDSVASWLHGVAFRLAAKLRDQRSSRRLRDRHAAQPRQTPPDLEVAWAEFRAVLDEEIAALPEKYRGPLVLCYLEGLTHEEAARRLGWPLGTVRGRVARARDRLRDRLARRGLALSALPFALLLAAGESHSAPPAALLDATLTAAVRFATGATPAAALVSARAAELANGGLRAMTPGPLRYALLLVLALGLAAAGSAALLPGRRPPEPPPPVPHADPNPAAKKPDADGAEPLPAGAVARLGTNRLWVPGVMDLRVVFAPDGKLVATPARGGIIRLWDVATGKLAGEVGPPDGKPNNVLSWRATFSPDGKTLAVLESPSRVRLWDVKNNKQLHDPLEHTQMLLAVAFAPDGKTVLVSSADGKLFRRDVATGKDLTDWPAPPGPVYAFAWSPDGKTLALATEDQALRLCDADTGRELRKLEGHRDRLAAVAWSPDGTTLATVSTDNTLRCWDFASGKETGRWPFGSVSVAGGQNVGTAMQFAADGKTLYVSDLFSIRSFEVPSGKELARFERKPSSPTPVGMVRQYGGRLAHFLSPDAKVVVTAELSDRLRTWDFATGKEINPPADASYVIAVAVTPDGKTVATGGLDHVIRLWDVASGKQVARLEGHSGVVNRLAVTSDGKFLVSGSTEPNDRTVSLWDLATGKEVRQFRGHGRGILHLLVSPDGSLLLTTGGDGLFRVFDLATAKELRQTPCHYSGVMAYSPDGKTLVLLGKDQKLQFLDAAAKDVLRETEQLWQYPGTVGFASDEKTLFGGSTDGSSVLQDGRDGHRLRWVTVSRAMAADPRPGGIPHPTLSPDGRVMATTELATAGGAVRLVEVSSGKIRRTLAGGQADVTSVAFTPDGRKLVAGSSDSTVLVWDLESPPVDEKALPAEPTGAELDGLWQDLAGEDAVKAWRAVRALAAAPAKAVPVLKKNFKTLDEKLVQDKIALLGSDEFAVRKRAEEDLERLGSFARPALQKLKESNPGADVAKRLEKLLAPRDDYALPVEEVVAYRVVEVLERAGTPEARQMLEELTGRKESLSHVADEAQGALARMKRR
jgi:RNA polymerase sigma factor (sigma-70 family)